MLRLEIAPIIRLTNLTLRSLANTSYDSDEGRNQRQFVVPLPTATGLNRPAGKSFDHESHHLEQPHNFLGQLLRGATDDEGKQKSAALLVGIKLDLEAEVHLTARVKGDICVGLY